MRKPSIYVVCVCMTLLSVISLGTSAATAAVQFLAGDTAVGSAIGSQTAPVIAQGNGGYLVVWQDLRTSPYAGPPFSTEGRGFDIYGLRLDATGAPLDAAPFIIASTFADQTEPKVAWNGQHWLVAWGGPNSTQWNHKIEAVRIAPDGAVLDATPIAVQNTQYPSNFKLTANGLEWLVVSQSTGASEANIRAVRIGDDGAVLNPGGTQLVASTYSLFTFDVASAQGRYLLVWGNAAVAPQGQSFDANLAPLGGPFPMNGLDVASNGTEYFVIWVVDDPYWDDFVMGQRVSIFGDLGPVVTLAGAGGGLPLWFPAKTDIGWDGNNWWVSWLEITRGVVFARVGPDDSVLDFGGLAVDPGAPARAMQGFALAGASTGGAQFVWQDDRLSGPAVGDIFAASVAADTMPGEAIPVSTSAPTQLQADMAAGNTEVIAVFASELSGARRIVAQRLHSNGDPIDPEPFEIANGPGVSAPRIAFDGTRYLVVWSENERILGKRVSPDGTVIDAVPLVIMSGQSPDVAGQAGTFLVVDTRPGSSVQFFYPYSMRVRGSDGVPLDTAPVLLGQYFARNPRVTAFAGRWLATWQRNISHDNPQAYLMASFIDADGTARGEFMYAFYGGTPAVAASAGKALFVWRSNSPQSANNDILGLIVGSDGMLATGPFVISNAADKQLNPSVAWNGSEFVVAWEDKRNAIIYFDERTDVFAARVDEYGAVADPVGFAFGSPGRPEILPSVAGTGAGTLIAVSTFRDDPAFQAYRIAHDVLPGGSVLASANVQPVAVASASPSSGEAPLTVTFSASGSYDPDGVIADYAWTFGDGGSGTGISVSHDYAVAGQYLAMLTVTDGQGASTSNVVSISVVPANQPPVAVATANPASGPAPLAVTLGSSGSYDPDDGIASVAWDFGDGSAPAYSGSASHTYVASGIYTATLTVTDHKGASASDTVNIDVAPPVQPPVAVAAATPRSGTSPLTVTFDSTSSSDPDGTIVAWRWDFGDGNTSNDPNPAHVYQVGGMFTAMLTVTDNDGAVGTDSVLIDVVNGDVSVMASVDFETPAGAVTAGSYLDTGLADGVYEALTEAETKGKPADRQSLLSHTWIFDVIPGASQTFHVKAHHTPNAEGDDFVFEYSRDGVAFSPMLIVSATAPGGPIQSYAFPGDVSGTLYVRVTDTDRTRGNRTADTLFVDEMFIVTSWQAGPS